MRLLRCARNDTGRRLLHFIRNDTGRRLLHFIRMTQAGDCFISFAMTLLPLTSLTELMSLYICPPFFMEYFGSSVVYINKGFKSRGNFGFKLI